MIFGCAACRRHGPCTAGGVTRDDLEARTLAFATEVMRICQSVRAGGGRRTLADQLTAAATAVGANYRATSRARSRAEFVAKIAIVAEEADESVYWLELGLRSGQLPAGAEALLVEARELRAMFAAAYRTARRHQAPRRGT